jgi:hypothetical protein
MLVELTPHFLQSAVMLMHKESHLESLIDRHVRQWKTQAISVYLSYDLESLPRFPEKVYEFFLRERDPETLLQREEIVSPPFAMMHVSLNHETETKYNAYLSHVVDYFSDEFSKVCWKGDDNGFQEQLFRLMTRLNSKNTKEACCSFSSILFIADIF